MGRITSKPISFKTSSVERISSHGFQLGCPVCTGALMLKDIWDGDQAYWCHTCNRGWRAGHLPPEARRIKAKALLEEALEIIPEPVILEVKQLVKVKKQKESKPVILEPEAVIIKAKLTTKKQKEIPELAKLEPALVVRSRKEKATLMLEPELTSSQKSRMSQEKPASIILEPVVITRLAKIKAAAIVLEPEPVKSKLKRKASVLEPVLAPMIPTPVRQSRRFKVEPEPVVSESVIPTVKKPKTKPVLLEPMPAQPKPVVAILEPIPSKARALRSALAHAAQQDLFA